MVIDLSNPWQIILRDQSDPTGVLAARELSVFLQQISSEIILISDKPDRDKYPIELSWGKEIQDGFEWHIRPKAIRFNGSNARGLLYAVYSFLEALGCTWFAPGMTGMAIPRGTRFDIKDKTVKEKAAFAGRCLILGHHAFMREADDWIIWAARNRINTLFFHVIDDPLALGAAPEIYYQRIKTHAVALARERGMTIEHGGHKLASLLPRTLFKRMPYAFRQQGDKRTNDHNFCPTNAEGLAVIRRNGRAWFEAHPEVDVFHLWPDDIPGGGWCECESCRDLSPSDQLLLAVNALAEELEQVNPQAQLSCLAYHDTEQPPQMVIPHANVCALWAPRMRCYAHPIDHWACKVNTPHYQKTFKALVKTYTKYQASPTRIFEYYLDAILFKSVLPPLIDTLQGDLKFYARAGAKVVQALMTGDAPWHSPQLNPWLFARLAWKPRQDAEALVKRFSQAAFNADLGPYIRSLEKAYQQALSLVPQQIKMVTEEDSIDPLNSPPVDMGDPFHASSKTLTRKAKDTPRIEQFVKTAQASLETAANGSPLLARERETFALHKAWLRFDCARVKLYRAAAVNNKRQIEINIYEAKRAYRSVLAWGEQHIADPRYRRNFELIHTGLWGLRLARIELDHTARGLKGVPLRVKVLARLATLKLQMRNVYEK